MQSLKINTTKIGIQLSFSRLTILTTLNMKTNRRNEYVWKVWFWLTAKTEMKIAILTEMNTLRLLQELVILQEKLLSII